MNDDIYVDKTGLIEYTNNRIGKRNRYVCVSRPRRFGKSMAAEMLAAYYGKECDSSKLFENYKIVKAESYLRNLNQFHVIALNMQNFLCVTQNVDEFIEYIQSEVLEELREEFPDKFPNGERFLSVALDKLYSRTKERFVFIIDEWDCILRERKYASDEHRKYLD